MVNLSQRIRPLLSFLILAALLGGSLSPAYASGGGGGHGGKSKEDAKKDAKAKKRDSVTITGGMTADDPIFLHLAPITLPVINDYGAQQIVTMLVDLHMNDLANAQKMQKEMPRIKDAVMQALYGGLADGTMRNANALDVPRIKTGIHETINRVFGGDHVREVLIQAVSQRKL